MMSPEANLTCFKVGCHGEFAYVGNEGGDTLYECRDCGTELREQGVRELAEMDGPVSQLARLLLEGDDA
jgi:hypothetical protein